MTVDRECVMCGMVLASVGARTRMRKWIKSRADRMLTNDVGGRADLVRSVVGGRVMFRKFEIDRCSRVSAVMFRKGLTE